MENNNPILFVEINEKNYIFVVGKYNENQNFRVVEKITNKAEGIIKGKFTNVEEASKTIKKNVEIIESKLNYIFKDVTVIIENFETSCINISGSKKLNGSQLLKENISYILNSLKSAVAENEREKTILHIFNSKSILDGTNVENLPIGLFGDFYSHELTFFLIGNNDLRNIKQIFGKSNLEVKKIILKDFSEGIQLINKIKNESFFKIKINPESSSISFFDQDSYRFSEHFKFGSNIIFKDIAKICSIDNELIVNYLSDSFNKATILNNDQLIEEKFFIKGGYRKIRKKLIIDIVDARIEEICNIIFKKNINLNYLKKSNFKIYITLHDKILSENFLENFKSHLLKERISDLTAINDFDIESSTASIADLSSFGWRKEAIPIIQTKNSLITRIFKSLFD